jgi:Tol biopolymer transport system component
MPTQQGVQTIKPTPLLAPTSTPLPSLTLPAIPAGEPPAELWSVLYLPLDDALAVHRIQVDVQGRRWSEPEIVYNFKEAVGADDSPNWGVGNLTADPTGNWLAVVVGYLESGEVWLLNLASQEAHSLSACEGYQLCMIRDWSPNGNVVILQRFPFGDNPSEFLIVDVNTNASIKLPVPKTMLTYSSVFDAIFSPDEHSIVWTLRGAGDRGETTEIWLSDTKGQQAEMLHSEPGLIQDVSVSPNGLYIAYSYAEGRQKEVSVRILSLENKENVSLITSPRSFSNPVWSTDGLEVAVAQCIDATEKISLTDQQCTISLLDHSGRDFTPVGTFSGRVYKEVSWAPGGTRLAFLAAHDIESLQAIWFFSMETGSGYPISRYVKPFSDYVWLPSSALGDVR